MAQVCRGCGNQNAYTVKTVYDSKTGFEETCNSCGVFSIPVLHDVFWSSNSGVEYNRNITDRMGRPIELLSKSHKARILKSRNHSEASDRVHGAPGWEE